MNRTLTHPVFWLMLASVGTLGLFFLGQHEPLLCPDSTSYLDFQWGSLKEALSQIRTPAYPAFLAFCQWITPAGGDALKSVPIAHSATLILAAWSMWWGMMRAGYGREIAAWCAVALMLGRAGRHEIGTTIAADSLAVSLSIMCVACYLATTSRRPGSTPWYGLALLTLATYLVRPAYLFLIPLWPVLCLVHDRFLLRPESSWSDQWRRVSRYALLSVVPFLAYCGLRWAVVGHFGLVSFGGYNIVGIAGQYLDDELVADLPEDLQALGKAIVKRRREYPGMQPPTDFLTMELMFNPTVWQCAVPAAKDVYDNDTPRINRDLGRLSFEILKRRPWQYARWLKSDTVHGLLNMMHLTVPDRGVALAMLLALLTHFHALVKRSKPEGAISSEMPAQGFSSLEEWQTLFATTRQEAADRLGHPRDTAQRHHQEIHLLFWTAIGFASAKLMLVILVEPASARYMTGAMSLFPAAVMVPVSRYFFRQWGQRSVSASGVSCEAKS
ncbi:MAG: hypothetical protein R3C01_04250 [Planctomycetaceae bacterium]